MKRLMLTALGAAALLGSGSLFATDGETLYKTKACVACHQIDTKVVGPSYKDVAAKYAGQDGAVETVADLYLEKRQDGERFLDTYRRIGMAPFKEALYA